MRADPSPDGQSNAADEKCHHLEIKFGMIQLGWPMRICTKYIVAVILLACVSARAANPESRPSDLASVISEWWYHCAPLPDGTVEKLLKEPRADEANSKELYLVSILIDFYCAPDDRQIEEQARRLLVQADRAGYAPARARLAYQLARQGLPADVAKAHDALKALSADAPIEANMYLGLLKMDGVGEPADPAAAVALFRVALARGYPRANGPIFVGVAKSGELVQAFAALRAGAECGDEQAQFMLGSCLCSGEGVIKNRAEGMKWLRVAAQKGYVQSQRLCGQLLMSGDGGGRVTVDEQREGLSWLIMAADRGDIPSRFQRACFGVRFGKPEVVVDAVAELKALADQGHVGAQIDYGRLLLEGLVIDRDLTSAINYFSRAAKSGDLDAKAYINMLEHSMLRDKQKGQ